MNAGNDTPLLIWIEAVNFDSVALDVDDLSAIRGGSEAMLALPELIIGDLRRRLGAGAAVVLVFSAASQAVAKVSGDGLTQTMIEDLFAKILGESHLSAAGSLLETADAGALLAALIGQLTFAVGVVAMSGDERADLAAAQTAARVSQWQRLTVDVPLPSADDGIDGQRPCRHDGVRPRNCHYFLPDATSLDDIAALSLSVALRRCLGRSGRRIEFYQRVIGSQFSFGCPGFANDFGELVEKQGPSWGGEAISRKIAVVWIDANNLTALRDKAVSDLETATAFATDIKQRRASLLADLIEWAAAHPMMVLHQPLRKRVDGQKRPLPVLRLEALLWGADEAMLVLPAWAIEPFLTKLSQLFAADRWTVPLPGQQQWRLTHAIGVLICGHKTPIRAARKLAQNLADAAKSHSRVRNVMQYMALSGLDLPSRDLCDERAALHAVPSGAQGAAFTFDFDHIDQTFAAVERCKGKTGDPEIGVARGGIAKLLRQASRNLSARDSVGTTFAELTEGCLDRGGNALAPESILVPALRASVPGAEHAPLIHILELWPFTRLEAGEPGVTAPQEAA